MTAAKSLPVQPATRQIPKHSVLVLHGFGIKLRMQNGHLCMEDGVGLDRRTIRLSRVEGRKLRRVILISSDGYMTLEALRFISDVGATFVMLDRRGKVLMVCGPTAPFDSKLHRSQSLALGNGTALRISKELISQKLDAQAVLVRDMLKNSSTGETIGRFKDELPSAESIESVRIIEAQAAKHYWRSWSDIPIRCARKDERKVGEHWKRFGSRISPLTHSPRLAANPPNAILNILYTLLESESRIAAVAMGLLPDIGLLHVNRPNRDSLVFDIMEPIRPKVDAFVLNWIQSEPLRKADFWEDRNGNCRIVTPLVIKLCETADTWRRFCAPVAEYVAQELWSSISKKTPSTRSIATRLTQRTRRNVKGSEVRGVIIPKMEHVCQGCGHKIPRDETRCLKCSTPVTRQNLDAGRRLAQRPESLSRRSFTQTKHKREIQKWTTADLPAWLTRDVYLTRVVPALSNVSKSTIRKALGVSDPYSIWIHNGTRIPHARHWQKLAELAGITT